MVLRHEETDRMKIWTTVDKRVKFRNLWSGLKRKPTDFFEGGGRPSIASVQQFLLLNWRKWRKIHIVLFAKFLSAANVTFEVH